MNKIIAIGDLHGDFQIFIRILQMCNLVNKKLEWTGEDTYLVQLGDTLDGKRPETKIEKSFLEESGEVEIIRLILDLDAQAKKFNGRVISLIGNHELYPYYLKNDKQFIRDYVKTKDIEQFRKVYNADRIKFLMPGGIGGSLIGRTRPLILQLGEFIFIHGSITDKLIRNGLSSKTGKVDIAKIKLANLNISNVIILLLDGFFGYSPQAPFDRIILTAAVEEIPSLLIKQLKVGGVMIIPVGLSNQKQSLLKVIKTEKGLDIKELMSVRFVQMKEGLVRI